MRYSDQMIAEAEARGDANAVKYWQHVRAVVDQAPEITPALRDQLRILLRPDPAPLAPAPVARRRIPAPKKAETAPLQDAAA